MTDCSERAGDADNPYRSPNASQSRVSQEQRRTHPITAALAIVLVIALLWPAVADSTAIRNFSVATYTFSAGAIVLVMITVSGVHWWRRRR